MNKMMNVDVNKFQRPGYQVFEDVLDVVIIKEVRDFLRQKIIETIEPAKKEIGCSSNSDIVELIAFINTFLLCTMRIN